ncbi:MAG: isoleucine--tRNA ligase [Conexivisphaerales archaeon]
MREDGASMPASRFELKERYDATFVEETVRNYWEAIDLKKLLRERKTERTIGWVEGPPTLNGLPHVGHVRGRIMKDLWHRFESMKGTKVIFNCGWDTQGLPVELEAEKELGLTGSKIENLKAVGESKIVETCKALIMKYHQYWLQCDRLLGLQMDDERAYWTYKDEYIEREWKYLEAAYKSGLLGEGYKVVPYCPSCQTSLSHEEVGLGYEQVDDPSVYYKAKVIDDRQDQLYLLVWTTMPFTIITDELVGVHPDEYYVYVKVDDEVWIVSEKRLEALRNELKVSFGEILSRKKGKELEGIRYLPPLLEEVSGQRTLFDSRKVHFVVAEEFVDITTGSGLVHLSPANGEEDYEVARKRSLPVFNPFDDSCSFTEEAGVFAQKFARDTDQPVVELLKKKGLLVDAKKIVHEYPLCWRSGHRLIYMARREYFYWIDRIKDLTLQAAQKVEYYYESPKNRFLNIIREGRPWNITRERVWGAPLPVWVCRSCGNKSFLFSRSEIVKNAVELPDGENFELHRPWIDRVVIRCQKCGGKSYREPFVLDTWHNSGAAPYAGLGEDEYRLRVPVPFLTEGIDQTRGWAYTLLVENVLLTGKPQAPYRSFLFQGHVLDAKGEKMSKSKGNYVGGLDALTRNSVDLLRFYMLWKAAPAEPISYIEEEMKERPYQVLNTLYHLHVYYAINSSFDNYSYSRDSVEKLRRGESLQAGVAEKWILSKVNRLTRKVREAVEARRFHEAAREFENFLIEDLSQKYVPLTRSILWDDSEEGRMKRFAVYTAIGYSLEVCDRLMHPFVPFVTEYLHKSVFGSREPLASTTYPEEEGAEDQKLEEEFSRLYAVLSLSYSARMKSGLKRRWPLRKLFYYGKKLSDEVETLLKELANVHEVVWVRGPKEGGIELKARIQKESAKKAGRMFGKLVEYLASNGEEIYKALQKEPSAVVKVNVDDQLILLTKEDLIFEVSGKEGYSAAIGNEYIVSLDTFRDKDLIAEGLLRDVARRFQALRKKKGYKPTEMLPVARIAGVDEEVRQALLKGKERLLYLIRAEKLEIVDKEKDSIKNWEESELDGRTIYIDI